MSTFCRVITGVSGSPRNLQALRYAALLARGQDAALVPVLAWVPPGGDVVEVRGSRGDLLPLPRVFRQARYLGRTPRTHFGEWCGPDTTTITGRSPAE